MTTTPNDPDPGAVELQLAEWLDQYQNALQAGGEAAGRVRSQLYQHLADHPELASWMECVDALDRLAPPPPIESPAGDVVSNDTPAGDSARSAVDGLTRPMLPMHPEGASDDAPVQKAAGGSSLFQSFPADLGSYELLEEIGRGGMGVVYRARHKSLQSPVAIKLIRSSQLASDDEIRRFYQEARAAAGLSHSHIIKVHDVGEHQGLHYLAMDLVEGATLSALLQEGPLPSDRAAEILVAVSRAVDYLHSRGIIHRDLKPANILLDRDGTPFVTDFGLAKVDATAGSETTTGAILGTPCYMSPEQAWGHANEVTTRSDVYSLGAILYELLSGRPPFREQNPLDVLLRVRESEPLPPSHWNRMVPPELEQICLRCLEKDPARRYPSAGALAEDLSRYLQGEPLNLPPVGWLHRLRRWARREPGLVARALGIVVAGAIEQAYYQFAHPTARDHWAVMTVLLVWGVASWLCQRLLNRGAAATLVAGAWATIDAVLYTLAVMLAAEPRELLIVGYPLLIVAAGFWLQVRLVWLMTAVCLAAYLVVYLRASDVAWPAHYPYLIGGILCLVGGFVSYQVHRLRVLTRYFERRA